MKLANKMSRGARKDFLPAPKLGQQSVEILREIGYDDVAIGRMVANGTTLDGRINRQ